MNEWMNKWKMKEREKETNLCKYCTINLFVHWSPSISLVTKTSPSGFAMDWNEGKKEGKKGKKQSPKGIGYLALLCVFVMVAVMWAGQRLRRKPEETKSFRTGGICTSILPGPGLSEAGPELGGPALRGLGPPLRGLGPPLRGLGQPLRGLRGGWTDRWTYIWMYRFPLFYRTSSPPVPSGAAALLT